jgi:hypothetical protein
VFGFGLQINGFLELLLIGVKEESCRVFLLLVCEPLGVSHLGDHALAFLPHEVSHVSGVFVEVGVSLTNSWFIDLWSFFGYSQVD